MAYIDLRIVFDEDVEFGLNHIPISITRTATDIEDTLDLDVSITESSRYASFLNALTTALTTPRTQYVEE